MSTGEQIESVRLAEIYSIKRLIGMVAARSWVAAEREAGEQLERRFRVLMDDVAAAAVPAEKDRCRAVEDGERCPRRRTGAKYCSQHKRPMRKARAAERYTGLTRALALERANARYRRIEALRAALGTPRAAFRADLRRHGEAAMKRRAFEAALARAKESMA